MSYPDIDTVLNRLPAREQQYKKLVEDQNVFDIVRHTLKMHKEYANDYDLFSKLFWQGDVHKTCQAIFDFCKAYIPYEAEPSKTQVVRNARQILLDAKTDSIPLDCKTYGLICTGIVDSLKRQGYPINAIFRFASDVQGDNYPKHVFCVVKTDESNIWLDPVLDRLNQYHKYYYFLDKKPPQVALYK